MVLLTSTLLLLEIEPLDHVAHIVRQGKCLVKNGGQR